MHILSDSFNFKELAVQNNLEIVGI